MASQESARILALKLHALHQEDRAWILSRLDSETQLHLNPLLQELNDLGFELKPEEVNSIEKKSSGLRTDSSGFSSASHIAIIVIVDSASPSQIASIFDKEPPIFLKCINSMQLWKWAPRTDRQLFKKPKVKRARGVEISPTPAAKFALLSAVVAQLEVKKDTNDYLINAVNSQHIFAPIKLRSQEFFRKLLPWK